MKKDSAVFGLFRKEPVQKLEKEYARKLELARDLQRKGDIVGYSEMAAAADVVLKQLEAEERKRTEG
jgi:hypothetical protein